LRSAIAVFLHTFGQTIAQIGGDRRFGRLFSLARHKFTQKLECRSEHFATGRGNTLTAFGSSLGLVTSDINGNFSHNIFTAPGGLTVVDRDAGNEILTLAFRGQINTGGAVPEPSSLVLSVVAGLTFAGMAGYRRITNRR